MENDQLFFFMQTPNTESDMDVVYSVVTVRPKNSVQRVTVLV